MNSYELSRAWFDFCFDNPEKISPNHSAIYFFAIEHCNRLGWKKKFGFPSQMTMDAIGIKKNQTYTRYFNELVDWGFFELVERSKNQWSANIITIKNAPPKNGKALDKAIIKHAAKQINSNGSGNGQSNSTIVKPSNQEPKNQEQTNKDLDIFDKFRKEYPGTKKGNETEFDNFKKKTSDWEKVLSDLSAILTCQINERMILKKSGQFVACWKNLSTWINQRCWEEVQALPDEEDIEARVYAGYTVDQIQSAIQRLITDPNTTDTNILTEAVKAGYQV